MLEDRPGAFAPAWAFILSLLAALCYFSLGHYDHNDHMYAVAPVLAQRLRIYSDFGFVQTPLSVLLFSQIYKFVGAEQFYTTLRLVSLTLHLMIVALGIAICYRHAKRKLFASLLFVSLYVSLWQDDIIGAEIGNYTLSLALTAIGLTAVDILRGRPWAPLVVGVIAGLALSAKLSYIYIVIAFGVMFLVWERAPADPRMRVAAYGLGVLIGIAPILYYLFANFDLFLFENVHFHYLSNIYRGIAPFPGLSNLGFFSASSAAVPLALLLLSCALAWGAARLIVRVWPYARTLAIPLTVVEKEILCIAAAAVVGAITPGVVFQQYFAAPAFALFLFAALYMQRLLGAEWLSVRWRDGILTSILALAMLSSGLRAYALTSQTVMRQREGVYGVSAVAGIRRELSGFIQEIDHRHPGCHGDLVTAFGVPAIGAGVRFAAIDSTGSFAMRLDDIFVEKAPTYRWMSNPLLYLTPKSLIMSGFYVDRTEPSSSFEPLVHQYAANHGFDTIALGNFLKKPIFLYIPPGCHIPPRAARPVAPDTRLGLLPLAIGRRVDPAMSDMTMQSSRTSCRAEACECRQVLPGFPPFIDC